MVALVHNFYLISSTEFVMNRLFDSVEKEVLPASLFITTDICNVTIPLWLFLWKWSLHISYNLYFVDLQKILSISSCQWTKKVWKSCLFEWSILIKDHTLNFKEYDIVKRASKSKWCSLSTRSGTVSQSDLFFTLLRDLASDPIRSPVFHSPIQYNFVAPALNST